MPAIVASIVSLKGGVGKTTTTANIAAVAADTYGLRVMIGDADPQGHLSDWFGIKRSPGMGFAELLNPPDSGRIDVRAALQQPDPEVPLWVLPTSYLEMEDVEVKLSTVPELGGIWSMSRAIQPLLNDFDLILLDTRPTLGNLTSAAVCASNVVLPITEPRLPSLQSTLAAVAKAERIREKQNASLVVGGWLLNKWGDHEEADKVKGELQRREVPVFQPAIYTGEYIPKAYIWGNPAVWQFPNNRGAHQDYKPLVGGILTSFGLVAA
ncbi:ParA family protein [Nonomuraea sp. NPDC051941]|uniref:ParA family protein n=1 Tax=Nonomuraea sp. NPDC051941 TaxID=3364373 RepID=UPI0037CC5AA6